MLEMRTVNPDEFFQWVWVEARAYGNRLNVDPEILRPHFDLERSIAVFDQGNIVGGAHSHKLEMSVPGGSAVVAGVANIAVQPTHTRRGILTRMMDHQLKDIHQRGEALAALFASESVIYGRYGYGMSTFREQWSIERQHNRYARSYDSPGQMVFVDPSDITKNLPEVFRRSTKDRPGVFQKSHHLWEREKRAPEHRHGGQGGGVLHRVRGWRENRRLCQIPHQRRYSYGERVDGDDWPKPTPRYGVFASTWTWSPGPRRKGAPWMTRCRGCWPTRAGCKGRLETACGCAWWT